MADPKVLFDRPAIPSTSVDRQIERLVDLDYPAVLTQSRTAFVARFDRLRRLGSGLADGAPLVVVVPRTLVPTEAALSRVNRRGRTGLVDMTGADPLSRYRPIEGLEVPAEPYVLTAVDLGDPQENLPPREGLRQIQGAGRTPLTIDEGVAVVTQFPAVLDQVTGLWLMGERSGDRRVPALWVSKKHPRLGWCWEGTPHDWLAPASCGGRRSP